MATTYSVKEIFYTLQGEGMRAGRPAVFCRFAGCNLWTGREEDRPKAVCRFCDTDFVGTDGTLGGKFNSPRDLATTIAAQWPCGHGHRYVVLTGGEPLLQVDTKLLDALHAEHFEIAVETNGSIEAPEGIDWICVSPKAGAPWVQTRGHELKLVYPAARLDARRRRCPRLRALPAAADGWPAATLQHPRGNRLLPGEPALAPVRADPQDSGDPLMTITTRNAR